MSNPFFGPMIIGAMMGFLLTWVAVAVYLFGSFLWFGLTGSGPYMPADFGRWVAFVFSVTFLLISFVGWIAHLAGFLARCIVLRTPEDAGA